MASDPHSKHRIFARPLRERRPYNQPSPRRPEAVARALTEPLVSASVTEPGWTSRLGHLRGPTFVVAEGLLMYLERAQVVQLARDLAKVPWGGPAEFAYDYYCAQMVGQAWLNPSLRRLGAEFKWGMAGPEKLSLGEPRWRVVDTYPVMERLGWPYDVLWPSFRFLTGVLQRDNQDDSAHCLARNVPEC